MPHLLTLTRPCYLKKLQCVKMTTHKMNDYNDDDKTLEKISVDFTNGHS